MSLNKQYNSIMKSMTYGRNKRGLISMTYGLTFGPNAVIIAISNEKTILGKSYV